MKKKPSSLYSAKTARRRRYSRRHYENQETKRRTLLVAGNQKRIEKHFTIVARSSWNAFFFLQLLSVMIVDTLFTRFFIFRTFQHASSVKGCSSNAVPTIIPLYLTFILSCLCSRGGYFSAFLITRNARKRIQEARTPVSLAYFWRFRTYIGVWRVYWG